MSIFVEQHFYLVEQGSLKANCGPLEIGLSCKRASLSFIDNVPATFISASTSVCTYDGEYEAFGSNSNGLLPECTPLYPKKRLTCFVQSQ
jgi:hypothetical protein